MRILVLGMSGYIGRELFYHLSEEHEVYGTYYKNMPKQIAKENMFYFDIANHFSIGDILISVKPDIVISSLCGDFDSQMKVMQRMRFHILLAAMESSNIPVNNSCNLIWGIVVLLYDCLVLNQKRVC